MTGMIQSILNHVKQLDVSTLNMLRSGNLSLRLANSKILITPSGFGFKELERVGVTIVGMDGKHLAGLKASSDLVMHLEIYKHKPSVKCIVHTHSHYATVMSIIGKPLKIFTTMHADYFGKQIYCMPYINHRMKNIGTYAIRSNEQNMLLANHGVLVFGDSIESVIERANAIEEVARINFEVSLVSRSVRELPGDDVMILHQYYERIYRTGARQPRLKRKSNDLA